MFLSNLSIKRPVFASVMMLALVTLGLFSWRRLPIDMMPDVEIPVLSIVAEFPGASPETVERDERTYISFLHDVFRFGITTNDAACEPE